MTDPNNGRRFTNGDPEEGTALYALNADEFDASLFPPREGAGRDTVLVSEVLPYDPNDPVAVAQYKAGQAAIELNCQPASERTPEQIEEVERLSEVARSMASEATLDAMLLRPVGREV